MFELMITGTQKNSTEITTEIEAMSNLHIKSYKSDVMYFTWFYHP